MAIKQDRPPASSDGDESQSLLSNPSGHPQPPSYQQSTGGGSGSGSYQQQNIYPAVPPNPTSSPAGTSATRSGQPSGPSPYNSLGTGVGATGLPTPVTHTQDGSLRTADRRARKRFFVALLWAFGAWFLIGFITGGIVADESSYKRGRHHHHDAIPGKGRNQPGGALKCNGFKSSSAFKASSFHPVLAAFSPSLQTSRTTFRLPLSSQDTLYLLGTGDWSNGAARFEVDPRLGGEEVVVDVEARWNDKSLLSRAQVCEVVKENGDGKDLGIEIWTPERGQLGDSLKQLTFSVVYRIPRSIHTFASLNVTAPIFSVTSPSTLPPLSSSIDISTSNAAITLASISAPRISLTTTSAAIKVNHAVATEALHVQTVNGRIDGSFSSPKTEVFTTNGGVKAQFDVLSHLNVGTKNGVIEALIALKPRGKKESDDKAEYEVAVKSTNAAVEVEYTEQPRGSHLSSEVESSNGHVSVKHSPEFQGAFEATNSASSISIVSPTSKDPKDSSRTRHLTMQISQPNTKSGTVWWNSSSSGEKDEGEHDSRGRSTVKTTNANVLLNLG